MSGEGTRQITKAAEASPHLILKFLYYHSILQMMKLRSLKEVSDLPKVPQLVNGRVWI